MKKNRIKKILLTTLAMLPCFNTYSFAAQNSRTVSQRTNSNSKNRRRQNNPETENEKTLSGYAPSDLLSYHKKHGIVSLTKALTKSPKGIPYLGGAGVLGAAGIGVLGFAGYKGGKFIQGKLKKPNPNLGDGNQIVEQNLHNGGQSSDMNPHMTVNPLENEEEKKEDITVTNTQPNVNDTPNQQPEVTTVVTTPITNTNPNTNTNANNNEQENQKQMTNNIPLANNIENNNPVKQSWKGLFDKLLKEKGGWYVLAPYYKMSARNRNIVHYKTCGLFDNKERHNTVNGDEKKCFTEFTSNTMQSFRIQVGGLVSGDYEPLFTACRWHEKGKYKNSEVESPIYWFGKFIVFGDSENKQATLDTEKGQGKKLMLSDLQYSLQLLWGKWKTALTSQNTTNITNMNDLKTNLYDKLNDALTNLPTVNSVESLYKTATEIDKLRLEYNYNLAQSAKTKKAKYKPLTILNYSDDLDPGTGFICLGNKIPNGGEKTFLQVITESQ